ncbi:hypothetical protein [Phaeodactylibacter luteus]|uniref:Uncharacterized protein n=1 Tax=Phaeodactylibacter luteus TaxID=1564516 RepID=A0A5C6RK76_9BACT|nr:hypothetical protein [Phaeodactylibacter luteus]TXB62374.1 hypothetical protein FRY97_14540 [Phaeodactylibacter luteus]
MHASLAAHGKQRLAFRDGFSLIIRCERNAGSWMERPFLPRHLLACRASDAKGWPARRAERAASPGA